MSSAFDFKENVDHVGGNPIHLSCFEGKVFVLEQTASRPKTVRLRNIDNLDGKDPDVSEFNLEDLPNGLRRELQERQMTFQSPMGSATFAEAM